jgi:hypothetical protein
MKLVLFVTLAVFGVLYVVALAQAVIRARRAAGGEKVAPTFFSVALGFVTSFFDTLGIGSFAPTTAVLKLRSLVPDEKIPGTLNVGHTLATLAQAYIFIAIVQVEMTTLVLMIVAACMGSWLGAGFVSRASRRKIQIGMGFALLAAATLFVLKIFEVTPAGGDTLGLAGWKLGAGFTGNFILGVLMEVGVGLYGPCMILVSLLGLTPTAAFPIMMGSCAFLMPVGSVKFIPASATTCARRSASRSAVCRPCCSPPSSSSRCRSPRCDGWWSASSSTPPSRCCARPWSNRGGRPSPPQLLRPNRSLSG